MTTNLTMSAELAEIIAAHKAIFGAAIMLADDGGAEPKGDEPKGDEPDGGPDSGDKSGEKLGEAGIKALQGERDARKALEKEVADLKSAKTTLDALQRALNPGKEPDPTADLTEQVAALAKKLEDREAEDARDALAKTVAADAGITDVNDVALIKAQGDEAAMKALAARLKGTPVATGGRIPRPDPSQGMRGGSGSGRPTSVREVMEERRAARKK